MPGKHNAGGCGCCCSECDTLLGYNHVYSLCGFNAVASGFLSTSEQSENDAVAALIESQFTDRLALLGGTNINYNWGPPASSTNPYFARVDSDVYAPGSAQPFNVWNSSGTVYNVLFYRVFMSLGAHWRVTGRACDPIYYWWMAIDIRESGTPPDSANYSFVTYGGSDYTGRDSMFDSGSSPYVPPPKQITGTDATACVAPSTLENGGVFSEIEITNSSGAGKIPVENPFQSGTGFVVNIGPSTSTAVCV